VVVVLFDGSLNFDSLDGYSFGTLLMMLGVLQVFVIRFVTFNILVMVVGAVVLLVNLVMLEMYCSIVEATVLVGKSAYEVHGV